MGKQTLEQAFKELWSYCEQNVPAEISSRVVDGFENLDKLLA